MVRSLADRTFQLRSTWLRELLEEDAQASGVGKAFALMAAWADSEHVLAAPAAPSLRRAGAPPLSDTKESEAAKRTAAAHLVAAQDGDE